MGSILATFPGVEEVMDKINQAKWFNFNTLPIENVSAQSVVNKVGLITYVTSIQMEYLWESTIAFWCNRLYQHFKNPVELKSGFQLEDLSDYGKPMEQQRLDKIDFDTWLPIYNYIKNEKQLHVS